MRFSLSSVCMFASALLLCAHSSIAKADTASSSWQTWRTGQAYGLCLSKKDELRIGADIHSNYLVRGTAVFHRPLEDLLAQKIGLLPELRWQYTDETELTWDTAIAMQARSLTRGEIRHAETVQNLRAHHCIPLDENWAVLTAATLSISIQHSGGIRYEAGAAIIRRLPFVTLELGLLEHQALWGDSPIEWAFTHAHLEAYYHFNPNAWALLPYVRIMGEQSTFDWSGRYLLAFQGGLRGRYQLSSIPLRWTFGADYLQRFDLDEWTVNLSFGVQWGHELESSPETPKPK